MNPTCDVCLRYLDGDLAPSESEDFDRLIAESPEVAGELARCLIDEHYFAKTQATDSTTGTDTSDTSALNQALRHLEPREESDQVFRELLRMEREAVVLPRNAEVAREEENSTQNNPLTWREVSGATIYLLTHAAKSTPVRWLAAAVVLITAALVITLITQTDKGIPDGPAMTQGPTDNPAQPTTQAVVARLSAVNDAQWQSGSDAAAPAVGDKLTAGQSLALLQGTAQLITVRGAIANLHAPCTIELLEGGNGLRLIHGRMVGICETESSKGFLVRTPHMDVTDLGTRFGVDASDPDATEVHVIEGEVKVALPATQADKVEQVLSAGEAVAAGADSHGFIAVAADLKRFAALDDETEQPGPVPLQGVRQITGGLQPSSASLFIGQDVKQWPASKNAFLFEEFAGRVDLPFMVNLVESGLYAQLPETPETEIPAGTAIRSFILIKTRNIGNEIVEVQGGVTFEGEVIGIIAEQSAADVFAGAVGEPSRLFIPRAKSKPWVDFNIHQDRVTLSEDRRTIAFAFKNKDSADMIRVLVRTEEAVSQP